MNPPAQAGTAWNIHNLLVSAVALLSLLGLAVSGYVLHNASVDRTTASDAASVNETSDPVSYTHLTLPTNREV